jgi:hypothetical protein
MCVSLVQRMCKKLVNIHRVSSGGILLVYKVVDTHILSLLNSHFNHNHLVAVLTILKVKSSLIHKIHNPYYYYHKINLVQY